MVDAPLITEGSLSLQAGKKAPAISKNVSVEKVHQTAKDFEAFFSRSNAATYVREHQPGAAVRRGTRLEDLAFDDG